MNAKQFGVGLAALHASAFVAFLVYVRSEAAERSQEAFYWLMWFPIDFPWSMLDLMFHWVIPDAVDKALGMPRYAIARYWQILVHGVLGTIWWYYLPQLVAGIFRRITDEQKR